METLVVFLAVLSVLVLIHEFGHFAAARLFGIRVDEFALGLPFTRPIFSKKIGETKYSLYPLLFGGFVKLHGEESDVKEEKERSFFHKRKLARLSVIVAGVVMNVVLALGAFFVLYKTIGVPTGSQEKVTIVSVADQSPAQTAGFREFDRVLKIEDKEVKSTEEFSRIIKSWGGLEVKVTVERGETVALFEGFLEKDRQIDILVVTPRRDPPPDQGAIGVSVVSAPYLQVTPCPWTNIGCHVQILERGIASTGLWAGRIVDGLRQIGQSLAQGQKPEGVSGPVGIYQLTGLVANEGLLPTIELVAVLSINLAIFNILPIPALDGGRAFFILLEAVRRKRISSEFEARVNGWGMAVLLGLILLVTLQDLIRVGVLEKLGIR